MRGLFDYVVVALVGIVVFIILRELWMSYVVADIFAQTTKELLDSVLYVLILIELFVILAYYLEKQHVSISSIVEIAFLAVARDLIFHIMNLTVAEIAVYGGILFILGFVHIGERWVTAKVAKLTK